MLRKRPQSSKFGKIPPSGLSNIVLTNFLSECMHRWITRKDNHCSTYQWCRPKNYNCPFTKNSTVTSFYTESMTPWTPVTPQSPYVIQAERTVSNSWYNTTHTLNKLSRPKYCQHFTVSWLNNSKVSLHLTTWAQLWSLLTFLYILRIQHHHHLWVNRDLVTFPSHELQQQQWDSENVHILCQLKSGNNCRRSIFVMPSFTKMQLCSTCKNNHSDTGEQSHWAYTIKHNDSPRSVINRLTL